MTAHTEDDMKNAWLANTPMGRLGVPADYQGAVVFLASDASAYATGHDLVVDGGTRSGKLVVVLFLRYGEGI